MTVTIAATGERRQDRFAATEVLFGAFRTLAGTVTAVNTATRTVTVADITINQPWEVVVTENSLARRLSPEAATRLAGRVRGLASAGSSGLLGELEELPALAINQLRPGDVVLIAASDGDGRCVYGRGQ